MTCVAKCNACGNDVDVEDYDENIEELLNELVEPMKAGDTVQINSILSDYIWRFLGKVV